MLLFTIDMDVNRPVAATKIYEMEGIRFCGVSPNQILADKLSVISGKNVFRRIKDVVDLYYLSKVFPFNGVEVKLALKNSDRVLGNFQDFLHRKRELQYAYDKFRLAGNISNPLLIQSITQ